MGIARATRMEERISKCWEDWDSELTSRVDLRVKPEKDISEVEKYKGRDKFWKL